MEGKKNRWKHQWKVPLLNTSGSSTGGGTNASIVVRWTPFSSARTVNFRQGRGKHKKRQNGFNRVTKKRNERKRGTTPGDHQKLDPRGRPPPCPRPRQSWKSRQNNHKAERAGLSFHQKTADRDSHRPQKKSVARFDPSVGGENPPKAHHL